MKFLDPKQWSKKMPIFGYPIPKGVLYFISGVVIVTVVLWAVGFGYRSGMYGPHVSQMSSGMDSSFMNFGGKGGGTGGSTGWSGGKATFSVAAEPPMMASREAGYGSDMLSIAPYPTGGYVVGNNAESFEVKEYSASIKVDESDSVCNTFAGLKSNPDIIFENANVNEFGCNFRFKVVKASAESIVSLIESFKPEQLDANTQTIKASLDDIANQETILKKKLESIDSTLKVAEAAYDDIAETVAKEHDSQSLAAIIQNKLALIERMTNERMMINQSLDQLSIQKTNQTDRLDYSFFNVNVYEEKIFDFKQLVSDWQQAARQFVMEFNRLLVGLTLGLVINACYGIAVALYLFLFLFIVKYVWRFMVTFMKK